MLTAMLRELPLVLRVFLTPLFLAGGVLWVLFLPLRLCVKAVSPLGVWLQKLRLYKWFDSIVLFDATPWFRWEVSQAGALLTRTRWTHRITAAAVAVGWFAMCVFAGAGGVGYLTSFGTPVLTIMFIGMIVVLVCAPVSLLGQAYYARLIEAWMSFDRPLCGECGHIRITEAEAPCPNCGSNDPPLDAGGMPFMSCIAAISFLPVAGAPIAVVVCGYLLFGGLLCWIGLGHRLAGVAVLAITVSLVSLGFYFLRFNLRLRKLVIRCRRQPVCTDGDR